MSDETEQPDPKDQEIASLKEQLEASEKKFEEKFEDYLDLDFKHAKAMAFLLELSHATPVNGKVQAGWVTNAKVLIQELNA